MIGRDLDFDLHNAIPDLIADGLLEENSDPHRVARFVIHEGMCRNSGVEETKRGH